MSMPTWFLPGEGIERSVISSSIQRYLGNDATVRPGLGIGEHENVPGYWIKAFRNLTSSQAEDLRLASQKYRNEQRRAQNPPPADPRLMNDHAAAFPGHNAQPPSHAYRNQGPARLGRPGGDSPNSLDTGYPGAIPRPGERYGALPPQRRLADPMDMDMDMDEGYDQPSRHRYEAEQRRFGDARLFEQERLPYQDTRQSYGGAESYGYRPPTGNGAYAPPSDRMGPALDYRSELRGVPPQFAGPGPSGLYPRQTDAPPFGYPPGPAASAPPMTHMQSQYSSSSVYQPPPGPPPGREGRGEGREPRYASNDYPNDRDGPRYAYPSPPVTVVGGRDGMPNAPSPSGYPGAGPGPMTSQYGAFDARSGPPPVSASYAAAPPGIYTTKTSPSAMNRMPGRRTGEGSEDGEPPSRRTRYN